MRDGGFVIGIGEAAFHMASLIAEKFSVVTTLARSIAPIERNLVKYGLAGRCGRVRASNVPVLALEEPGSDARRMIEAEIKRALAEDGRRGDRARLRRYDGSRARARAVGRRAGARRRRLRCQPRRKPGPHRACRTSKRNTLRAPARQGLCRRVREILAAVNRSVPRQCKGSFERFKGAAGPESGDGIRNQVRRSHSEPASSSRSRLPEIAAVFDHRPRAGRLVCLAKKIGLDQKRGSSGSLALLQAHEGRFDPFARPLVNGRSLRI